MTTDSLKMLFASQMCKSRRPIFRPVGEVGGGSKGALILVLLCTPPVFKQLKQEKSEGG